jgi:uncharacterized protein (TIGR00251 family)
VRQSPFRHAHNGATVAIRLTPKAKTVGITGIMEQADGGAALKVSVTAAPERGKANAAMIALLAKTWRLPKSAITLAVGATDRRKVVHISGDPNRLKQTLDEWMVKHHG